MCKRYTRTCSICKKFEEYEGPCPKAQNFFSCFRCLNIPEKDISDSTLTCKDHETKDQFEQVAEGEMNKVNKQALEAQQRKKLPKTLENKEDLEVAGKAPSLQNWKDVRAEYNRRADVLKAEQDRKEGEEEKTAGGAAT